MREITRQRQENLTPGGVQSIERAFDLLECLARARDWIGISELREATGQPVGTIHRILKTLVARGYVVRDGRTRRYALGSAFRTLIGAGLHGPDWARIATPLLRELVEISGETANLAVIERDRAVYVAQAQSARMVRMFTEIGNRVPLHATGCGKVLLAYQPDGVVESILAQSEHRAYTARTVTNSQQLRQELESVRRRGYAVDDEEQEEGVRCLSVPVFGPGNRVVAAISISGPSSRVELARLPDLVPHLKRISTALAAILAEA